ncbi:MAG: methyl-accepting chemotaxis protein [Microcoleaceae cyanobacterium]
MLKTILQKIQYQLMLLVLLSTVLPVAIVGFYAISTTGESLRTLALNSIDTQLTSDTTQINNYFNNIASDIVVVSKVPPIQGIVRSRDNNGIDPIDKSTYQNWINRLNTIFAGFMEAKGQYLRLRYLDENGQEMVKVERSISGDIKILTGDQLRNRDDQEYVDATLKLPANQIYTSDIFLHKENDQIVNPYIPTIRYSTPIYNKDGKVKGLVIINAKIDNIIDVVTKADETKGVSNIMIDQDGYYIHHPESKKLWGRDLKNNENIKNDYPAEILEQLFSTERKVVIEDANRVIDAQKAISNQNSQRFFLVIHSVPNQVIFASLNSFKRFSSFLIFISIAISLGIGWLIIKNLVGLIQGLVLQISSLSTDIVCTMNDQESTATHQSTTVNDTTNSVNHLGAVSQQIAQQAETVASAARKASDLAEDGTTVVAETLQQMLNLQEAVNILTQQNQRLNDQTSQIGNISSLASLVSDLAAQTNVLALNAAVEASRAGEYGDGFAVVAKEIRTLADQSRNAAKKISVIVPEIQRAIGSTVKASEQGQQIVEIGVKNAKETTETFENVKGVVSELFASNQQIYENAEQQAIAIQQVINTMNSLNQTTMQSLRGLAQVKQGTQKLNEIAQQLRMRV